MNQDLMLSKSELAALDVLIDAMAAQKAAGAMADPTAFWAAIARTAIRVTRKICPAAVQVTANILGGQAAQDPKLQELAKDLSSMPEPTLEQLIVLRSIQPDQ